MEKSILNRAEASKSSSRSLPNTTAKSLSGQASGYEKSKNHKIELDNHRLLSVTGVKGVPAFSDREIRIDIEGEALIIGGQNLEINLLDLESGRLACTGHVTSLRYTAVGVEKSFLKRLVK